MQTLNVSTVSISDVKKSPGGIFELANRENNAVYVFNDETIVGVMLTKTQYEDFQTRIETLYEELWDSTVLKRIQKNNIKHYSDSEVRVESAARPPVIDENDGWE